MKKYFPFIKPFFTRSVVAVFFNKLFITIMLCNISLYPNPCLAGVSGVN